MRQDRGWSQVRGFEELREGLHFGPKSRASYVALEAGRPPTPDEAAYLISYFGKSPDDLPEPLGATESPDTLIAALRDQARAIDALVARLDILTAEQATSAGEMMKALGVLGGRPALQETRTEGEPGALGGTGR